MQTNNKQLKQIVNNLKIQNKDNNKPYAEQLVYNINKEKQKGSFSNSFFNLYLK